MTCVIRNAPTGLGEPAFDKFEALLAQAMLSIPATKGFEIGSGFGGCAVPGSVHNDAWVKATPKDFANGTSHHTNGHSNGNGNSTPPPRLTTKTNNSGGVQGGITNGSDIFFRVAFKPAATIGMAQTTTSFDFEEGVLEAKGRHDPCVVPRAVPIGEAMAALVVMNCLMAQQARRGSMDDLARTKRKPLMRRKSSQ